MLADYHVLRKHKLKLNDLYLGNSSSIYWFYKGVNWRAVVAFFSGVWPLLRKSPQILKYSLLTNVFLKLVLREQ